MSQKILHKMTLKNNIMNLLNNIILIYFMVMNKNLNKFNKLMQLLVMYRVEKNMINLMNSLIKLVLVNKSKEFIILFIVF
jgi:hypothetical protein